MKDREQVSQSMDSSFGIVEILLSSGMPCSLLWRDKNKHNYRILDGQVLSICRKAASCVVISEAFLDHSTYEVVTGKNKMGLLSPSL